MSNVPSDVQWRAGVLTVSDRVSRGAMPDVSGPILVHGLHALGAHSVQVVAVADSVDAVRAAVSVWTGDGVDVIVTTGGTGLGPNDVTPEALVSLWTLTLPGIGEAFRAFSASRAPYAMLSRCVAGTVGSSLVIAIPGSPSACKDALECLGPTIVHAICMIRGGGHE